MEQDPWSSWAAEYAAADPAGKSARWAKLTEEQRRYLTERFGVQPPPQVSQNSRKVPGCLLGVLALLLVLAGLSIVSRPGQERTPSVSSTKTHADQPGTDGIEKKAPAARPQSRIFAKKAGANIRSGPGTSHPAVAETLSEFQAFSLLEKTGEWYKVAEDRYIHESVVLTESEKARYDSAELLLLSWRWSHQHGYATAEGQLKNISNRRLENVQAVVTWLDASGNFITSDTGLVEYRPLLPGQTSPFRVMVPHNPAMKSARIDFKFLLGGSIPWIASD